MAAAAIIFSNFTTKERKKRRLKYGFMSLDNIQLPAIILQGLFNNSLVDLETSNDTAVVSQQPIMSFLGNNQKRLIIVVEDENAVYVSDVNLNFLSGILAACKLSMADVALVNMARAGAINYITLEQQLQAEKILLFGVPPARLELPLQFPFYQIQKFNNQVYLAAPALNELEGDKTEKAKLWNCLKQVFSIG
jgi:DNA polymerase III psi subunit